MKHILKLRPKREVIDFLLSLRILNPPADVGVDTEYADVKEQLEKEDADIHREQRRQDSAGPNRAAPVDRVDQQRQPVLLVVNNNNNNNNQQDPKNRFEHARNYILSHGSLRSTGFRYDQLHHYQQEFHCVTLMNKAQNVRYVLMKKKLLEIKNKAAKNARKEPALLDGQRFGQSKELGAGLLRDLFKPVQQQPQPLRVAQPQPQPQQQVLPQPLQVQNNNTNNHNQRGRGRNIDHNNNNNNNIYNHNTRRGHR